MIDYILVFIVPLSKFGIFRWSSNRREWTFFVFIDIVIFNDFCIIRKSNDESTNYRSFFWWARLKIISIWTRITLMRFTKYSIYKFTDSNTINILKILFHNSFISKMNESLLHHVLFFKKRSYHDHKENDDLWVHSNRLIFFPPVNFYVFYAIRLANLTIDSNKREESDKILYRDTRYLRLMENMIVKMSTTLMNHIRWWLV